MDTDEAGRALEAELMEDTTADEETPSIGGTLGEKEENDGAQKLVWR